MKTEKKLLPLILAATILLKAANVMINFLSLLGLLVVWLIQLIFQPFKFILKFIVFSILQVIPKKRGRGRPRSRPFKEYLGYKFKPILNLSSTLFPKPIRIGLLVLILLGTIFYYSWGLVQIANQLPSPERLSDVNGALTTTFYDRNGQVLYRLFEDKNRYLVQLSDIPPVLQEATIAIEDKNFYSHSGVDIEGVMRGTISYFKHQDDLQGGSTITQQLIKNTLLSPERTLQRKVKEIILAFWAERVFTKQQILQMYFNEVPYGGTAYGIGAAATTYFGKQPKDLDLAEASYLAGLPASPTVYSPYGSHPELGKQRQQAVLHRMVQDKYITISQALQAYNEQLVIKPQMAEIKAPHFVMYTKDLLAQKYGDKMVDQGGLKIYTSLDLGIQEMAEKVVSTEVKKLASLNVGNGAAEIVDPRNGQILAMVGSKDYWDPIEGSFNVTTALRQPGSSIKPATYTAAFKMGLYSPGSVILDEPVSYSNAWETYSPVNYDGTFHGPVTIRTALGSSYNIPAVKVLAAVGIPNMVKTAQDLGITTFTDPDRYGLSLTLGGAEVKMIDMMGMYSTFSQMGIHHYPEPILKVIDPSGNILEDNTKSTAGNRVLPEGVAYMITNILIDNKAREPEFGPNSLLKIPGHTVAAKTGTTDNKKDNWTFGFTPEIAVGVWVGNNNGDPMDPVLSSGITGAAPIWNKLMTNLLKDKPDLAFQRPTDVVDGIVDGHKDLVIAQMAKNLMGKSYQSKNSPTPADITFTNPLTTINTRANP